MVETEKGEWSFWGLLLLQEASLEWMGVILKVSTKTEIYGGQPVKPLFNKLYLFLWKVRAERGSELISWSLSILFFFVVHKAYMKTLQVTEELACVESKKWQTVTCWVWWPQACDPSTLELRREDHKCQHSLGNLAKAYFKIREYNKNVLSSTWCEDPGFGVRKSKERKTPTTTHLLA